MATNRAVWKYELSPLENRIAVPLGAQWLYAVAQRDTVVAYALVDPDENTREINRLWVVGTGHAELPAGLLRPLGVAVLEDGLLMFHVFLVK